MSEKILVVDDEREIADLLELYLKNEGYEVVKCFDAESALAAAGAGDIDLALLDVVLPESDGFALCRKIRESFHYPIIMVSSRNEALDKINGLSLGADDYVTKPFTPMELMARIKAQLRRTKRYDAAGGEKLLVVGGLTLEPESRRCTVDERPVELTPREFDILRILCQRRGTVLSSEELFRLVWGEAYFSKSSNPIPVHIRHIRDKLGDDAEHPRYIQTVWGVGYKIEG